jgi:acyl-CoA synthetase (AMP-forming)/AMP-acid ligase II
MRAVAEAAPDRVVVASPQRSLTAAAQVVDAAVIGEADPRWGQRVVGVVALDPARRPSDAELTEHCRSHLAGFKVPRR